jgi:hypothetical protein
MLYIEQSLGPDEELVHVGSYHWMYDVQAAMNIVFGALMAVVIVWGGIFVYQKTGRFPSDIGLEAGVQYLHPGIRIFAFVMFLGGLLSFSRMMIDKSTTEIAITNLRIVYKKGLLARHVGEIAVDRIEGVIVLQTIMGRLFDYGRLAVRGMGVGEVVLPPIAKPILFRQAIQRARAHGQPAGRD